MTRAVFTNPGASSANQFVSGFIPAFDGFESGGLTGGWGWLDTWTTSGAVSLYSVSSPYEGTYHMQVDKGAEAKRSTDLSAPSSVRLQFWVRFSVDGGGGNRSLYVDDLMITQ